MILTIYSFHIQYDQYMLNKSHIISTDEDLGLRIESFAVINLRQLRGVSTNITIIYFITMQTYKELTCQRILISYIQFISYIHQPFYMENV
jgi:hypothetical protein